MKELRHLQLVILEIAKYIDKLCRDNGIEYFILGGSAIGAIRHKGFVPWDDDFDIIMDNKNYEKFCQVCRTQLDNDKYYFQEGEVDWPCMFSKVKLRGTVFKEPSAYIDAAGEQGIFVDIFKMDNSPSNRLSRLWQFCCAKYLLCYSLYRRGFSNPSFAKRLLLIASLPLRLDFLRLFLKKQVEKWNKRDTKYCAYFYGPYRLSQCFFERSDFANSVYVPFEDTEFPVPVGYDHWLRHVFGDYMTPPPPKQQIGSHYIGVDFGKY